MITNNFKRLYDQLDHSNVDLLDDVYARNIAFIDPFHTVTGLDDLKEYVKSMYQNIKEIKFEYGESFSQENNHFVAWVMIMSHPKLNGGKSIKVNGATHLRTDSEHKIVMHRDYFDAGELLYENVPVIGKMVKLVKRNM